MGLARFGRQVKRQHGVCVKMTAVAISGLCFIFVWSMFSSPSTSVTVQRESFDDIAEPVASSTMVSKSKGNELEKRDSNDHKKKVESNLKKKKMREVNGSLPLPAHEHGKKMRNMFQRGKGTRISQRYLVKYQKKIKRIRSKKNLKVKKPKRRQKWRKTLVVDGNEEGLDGEGEEKGEIEGDADLGESVEQETEELVDNENEGKKRKIKGPVFDPKAHYSWKLCSTRSKHNYMPCVDVESGFARLQGYRHRERTCPKAPAMCLVPLPHDGYDSPVHRPESKLKILYKNVAHPKLAAYMKNHNWLIKSGEYLMFPQNQSEFKGGVVHYLESIEEMVPDIEWGKNIRVVLDVGSSYSSFMV